MLNQLPETGLSLKTNNTTLHCIARHAQPDIGDRNKVAIGTNFCTNFFVMVQIQRKLISSRAQPLLLILNALTHLIATLFQCYETGNYVTSRKAGLRGIWNTP